MLSCTKLASYSYRFREGPISEVAQIWSVGHEVRSTVQYRWHGNNRPGDNGKHILQYTLSGLGAIHFEGKIHALEPGQAFLVDVPSNHAYYLPVDSEKWEFLFIVLFGREVEALWKAIREFNGGPVISLHPESTAVDCLFDIYHHARNGDITDGYYGASIAYRFVMELHRTIRGITPPKEVPPSIMKALTFMQTNYGGPLTVDDIAQAASLSKFHFCKLFGQVMGGSPLQYLTKIRIEKAAVLLRGTPNTIADIAASVGYANGNYFCKVFRSIVGITPSTFRSGETMSSVAHPDS